MKMKINNFLISSVILFSTASCSIIGGGGSQVDSLKLYQDMTAGKSLFSERTGSPVQLNASEKICIDPVLKGSDATAYYELTKKSYKDYYDNYGKFSQYAKDVAELVKRMDGLLDSFSRSGLLKEIASRGMKPALMFDIDNTIEFTAGADSDPTGDGPPIVKMVDFVKRRCFKNKLACYFITARWCNSKSVKPTVKWLKNELGLNDEMVNEFTRLSGSLTGCSAESGITVAYKDVVRQALAEKNGIFWLMSIGDQLTDSLGYHSGMKMLVPNQLFHSDIVPNQFAPWGRGKCGSPRTIAPDASCSRKLMATAIEKTSVSFCGACDSDSGCN